MLSLSSDGARPGGNGAEESFVRVSRVVAAVVAVVGTVAGLAGPAVAAPAAKPRIVVDSLVNGGRPCATGTPVVLGGFADQLEAVGRTSGDTTFGLDVTFAIWPSADPTDVRQVRTTIRASGDRAHGSVPDGVLTSGVTYTWHVRVADRTSTSAWSPTCTFTVDTTSPPPPLVTSNYPPAGEGPGPLGRLAHFVFRSGGDPDVAGYLAIWGDVVPVFGCSYGGPSGGLVCPDFLAGPYVHRAAAPGGAVAVDLQPPWFGENRLSVLAVDVAGNVSSQVQYAVDVPYSSPEVQVATPLVCGSAVTLGLAPAEGLTHVASYEVTVLGHPAVSVPARGDGTAVARIAVQPADRRAEVVSVGRNGYRSTSRFVSFDVRPVPDVTSNVYPASDRPAGGVGVPGTFTFAGPDTFAFPATYVYSFDGGPAQRVAFDENTSDARVTWTPTHAGATSLTVRSLAADGTAGSCTTSYDFVVAGP